VENDLALTVEGLTKYYNSFLAVDHIRFQVRRGEIYGFLGPNGAGKTTTIRMLCGLITPSDGRANIMGFDIQKESVKVKRQIGVVPEISNLYDELTSFENLVFMAQLYGVPKSHRGKRAEELIQLIRLEEKKETLFSGLSKGMKRNLTIAAALVHDPPLIFLDEPTSGLDVVNARNLRSMIRHLNQRGTTIFLTTHN
jgi:ABC-2 type transport system ATP-binding protein